MNHNVIDVNPTSRVVASTSIAERNAMRSRISNVMMIANGSVVIFTQNEVL